MSRNRIGLNSKRCFGPDGKAVLDSFKAGENQMDLRKDIPATLSDSKLEITLWDLYGERIKKKN